MPVDASNNVSRKGLFSLEEAIADFQLDLNSQKSLRLDSPASILKILGVHTANLQKLFVKVTRDTGNTLSY